ncbi:MAG: caspase family protein, partial [bacterium]
MQKIKLTFVILALILKATNFTIVALSANHTSNVALLVGINKYPNLLERYQLHGCVNDVAIVETLLCEKFQFDKSNIKILTDELATRTSILKQFREFLIANATSDGQAVFYYSGHGSRMTDLNDDEMDGWDETIVPYDSRDAARTVLDIPDDTLRALLGRLTDKCKNVTVIFDCCRSGSGIRGETAIPRQCEDLVLEQPKAKAAEIIKDGPSGFLPPDPDYVFISACRDREYAYESYGHGALTLRLNEVIRQHPNATYREVMYKITEKVNAAHPSQHPQLEGKRRDAKIFGNLGVVENFVEVIKVENDQVQLNAGAVHNVTERSIYALYMPGTTSTRDETKYLGKVKISDVKSFTSWAIIEEGKEKIVKNAAEFEIAQHYGDLQLSVRLDMKDATELEQKIEDILTKHKEKEDLVKLVSGQSSYDVNIRLDKNSNQLILERQDLTRLKEIDMDEQSIQYQLPNILTKEA